MQQVCLISDTPEILVSALGARINQAIAAILGRLGENAMDDQFCLAHSTLSF